MCGCKVSHEEMKSTNNNLQTFADHVLSTTDDAISAAGVLVGVQLWVYLRPNIINILTFLKTDYYVVFFLN